LHPKSCSHIFPFVEPLRCGKGRWAATWNLGRLVDAVRRWDCQTGTHDVTGSKLSDIPAISTLLAEREEFRNLFRARALVAKKIVAVAGRVD
jgi:hypothetical protein